LKDDRLIDWKGTWNSYSAKAVTSSPQLLDMSTVSFHFRRYGSPAFDIPVVLSRTAQFGEQHCAFYLRQLANTMCDADEYVEKMSFHIENREVDLHNLTALTHLLHHKPTVLFAHIRKNAIETTTWQRFYGRALDKVKNHPLSCMPPFYRDVQLKFSIGYICDLRMHNRRYGQSFRPDSGQAPAKRAPVQSKRYQSQFR
jgi:hypothetical protein